MIAFFVGCLLVAIVIAVALGVGSTGFYVILVFTLIGVGAYSYWATRDDKRKREE